jgi:hypothetical protein
VKNLRLPCLLFSISRNCPNIDELCADTFNFEDDHIPALSPAYLWAITASHTLDRYNTIFARSDNSPRRAVQFHQISNHRRQIVAVHPAISGCGSSLTLFCVPPLMKSNGILRCICVFIILSFSLNHAVHILKIVRAQVLMHQVYPPSHGSPPTSPVPELMSTQPFQRHLTIEMPTFLFLILWFLILLVNHSYDVDPGSKFVPGFFLTASATILLSSVSARKTTELPGRVKNTRDHRS